MSESNPPVQGNEHDNSNRRLDVKTGLYCMSYLAKHRDVKLSMSDLNQQFGNLSEFPATEMIRAYSDLGIKCKAATVDGKSVRKMSLPAIIQLEDQYLVLKSIDEDIAVVHALGQTEDLRYELNALLDACQHQLILVSAEEMAAEKQFGFKWFVNAIWQYKSIMRETLIASFFIQLFALVTPLFFMIVIDKVFSHNNLSTLNVLIFAMVVVSLFDVILNGIRTYLLSHTTNRVDMKLGMRLFKHMMALPMSYFESRRTGDTIARIKEVEVIRNFLTGSSLTVLIDLFFVFVFIAVMYLFSAKLATIVLISLPLFFLVSFVMTPLMKSKLEDKHDKIAENQSFLVETLNGMEMIKSGAIESQQQRAWEKRLSDYAKCSFNSTTLSNLINQSQGLISKMLTVILLFIGAKLVLAGELSVGQLIAFNMLTSRVIAPIQRLAQIWQEFTSARVSIKRVADILDMPTEPMMLTGKTELPPLAGDIEFVDVSFKYHDNSPSALQNVSFTVGQGEVVGVVGSTGSGKTTLVKLLQRLYVPTAGKVMIDGHNVISMDGGWLRSQIGVVAQDFVLFNRTIKDNITLGDLSITDEQVVEVCKLVGAHDMIVSLAEGYDTLLQERGLGLSTGQRQNIALARALVSDPKILILDEATSALDYESEHAFQMNFKKMTEGRTTFVVAHRLSTLRHADRILTVEGGQLIENEHPEKLLASGGRFSHLYDMHNLLWGSDAKKDSEKALAGGSHE